ncbi:MAG: copper resistance protein CopC [Thermoleophilia bacterium]|nr:copper resistance protein CopC [Thermoleophilia bacterium]
MAFRRSLALTACSLVVATPTAMGHSGLMSSTPKNGASLGAVPKSIVLTFESPIARALPAKVLRGKVNFAKRTRLHPRARNKVVIITKGARRLKGVYRVAWTVQHLDGHRTRGVVRFRVR